LLPLFRDTDWLSRFAHFMLQE